MTKYIIFVYTYLLTIIRKIKLLFSSNNFFIIQNEITDFKTIRKFKFEDKIYRLLTIG